MTSRPAYPLLQPLLHRPLLSSFQEQTRQELDVDTSGDIGFHAPFMAGLG